MQNIDFSWPGGTWATYRLDIDESQDLGVPFLPCPTWGWISWRRNVLIAEADHSSCEFVEHRARRLSVDLAGRPVHARETWLDLARAVTEGAVVEDALDEYDERDSPLLTPELAAGGAGPLSPPSPTMEFASHRSAVGDDLRLLRAAAAREQDLVLGLPEEPIDLESDEPVNLLVRFLAQGAPHEARISVEYPANGTFRVVRLLEDGSATEGFEGWMSFPSRSPLFAGFEDLAGDEAGWIEAPMPNPCTEDDIDGELMSPARLVELVRTLLRARGQEIGRCWSFAS